MKMQSSFVNWNFVGETVNGIDDIWQMCVDDVNYPLLSWQFVPDFVCPDGVNFIDYSFFAGHWQGVNCPDLGDCDGCDLDFSALVDANDLKIFSDHWL